MTIVETYASEKLQCGTAELCMLEKVYSPLAESAFEKRNTSLDEILEEYTTLDDLLYITYNTIADTVDKILKEKVKSVGEELDTYIEEQLYDFESRVPYINYLDTHFDSTLDYVVNWNKDVEYNADLVFDKWVEAWPIN